MTIKKLKKGLVVSDAGSAIGLDKVRLNMLHFSINDENKVETITQVRGGWRAKSHQNSSFNTSWNL